MYEIHPGKNHGQYNCVETVMKNSMNCFMDNQWNIKVLISWHLKLITMDTRYPVSTSCIHVLWISNSVGSEIIGLERCTQMVLKCIVDASYSGSPFTNWKNAHIQIWCMLGCGHCRVRWCSYLLCCNSESGDVGCVSLGGYGEGGEHMYRMKWYFRAAKCNNHSRCFTDGGP